MGTWFGMVGVRLPTHNTLKTTTMVQEKQLKELFKYIEHNWDVCVSQVDKTDIKRIFGGVLCEDIMNNTLHEVKAEPELYTKPTDQVIDQVTDHEQASSQVKLDNSFDRDRFEAMFRAVVVNRCENTTSKIMIEGTEMLIAKLDAYYASKEGGNNE